MKVKQMLDIIGGNPLSAYEPEGRQITEYINIYSINKYHYSKLTGTDAIKIIEGLPADEAATVFELELNDGLNLIDMRDSMQKMIDTIAALNEKNHSATMRMVITISMGLAVFISSMALTALIVYVSVQTKTFPAWQLAILPLAPPAVVIWQVFGVLTQERRDVLMTILGKGPRTTMYDAVTGFIANKAQTTGSYQNTHGASAMSPYSMAQPSATKYGASAMAPGFDPSDPNNYK